MRHPRRSRRREEILGRLLSWLSLPGERQTFSGKASPPPSRRATGSTQGEICLASCMLLCDSRGQLHATPGAVSVSTTPTLLSNSASLGAKALPSSRECLSKNADTGSCNDVFYVYSAALLFVLLLLDSLSLARALQLLVRTTVRWIECRARASPSMSPLLYLPYLDAARDDSPQSTPTPYREMGFPCPTRHIYFYRRPMQPITAAKQVGPACLIWICTSPG